MNLYNGFNLKEASEFRSFFRKFCNHEISEGRCDTDDCEFCPIDKAYHKIFEEIPKGAEDEFEEEQEDEEKPAPLDWEQNHDKTYWCASRKMSDGICNFIYCIFPHKGGGYTAEASNNMYGACRVAVKNKNCNKESVFMDLEKLKKDIENRNILWLYVSHCNCIGEITKEER